MDELVRVYVGTDRSQLLAVAVLEHSIRRHTGRQVQVCPLIDLDLPEPLLKMLQAFKLTLALDHDSVDQGELRQKEVGKGNRFESGEVPPGFGRKIPQ